MEVTRGLAGALAVVGSTRLACMFGAEVYGRHDTCMIGSCL